MRRIFVLVLLLVFIAGSTWVAAYVFIFPGKSHKHTELKKTTPASGEKKESCCVFKTVMGEESADSGFIYKTPEKVQLVIKNGLAWMSTAQNKDGGWGAGSHSRQDVLDPHAVHSDPATTAMVCMAMLRCDNTLSNGPYFQNLNNGLEYLLKAVEASAETDETITKERETQPQRKLGSNIDVVLTSQFLTNILDYTADNKVLEERIKTNNEKCIRKMQKLQNVNGSFKGSGWAGVLQSALASNALETAQAKGLKVDTVALDKSRNYQKGNFDAKSGTSETSEGAGVVLYSVSGASRASSKEARVAKYKIAEAKKQGKLKEEDEVTSENLSKAGLSDADAMKYSTAYEINESAKQVAQKEDVMSGFGNNGGEEYISYLQTGEGMIMGKDSTWKNWYDNVSGKLIKFQNKDGSWNGHHCITSPVFCTATCLLILSVNNDLEKLLVVGEK